MASRFRKEIQEHVLPKNITIEEFRKHVDNHLLTQDEPISKTYLMEVIGDRGLSDSVNEPEESQSGSDEMKRVTSISIQKFFSETYYNYWAGKIYKAHNQENRRQFLLRREDLQKSFANLEGTMDYAKGKSRKRRK